jgi:hypothetical protein
MGMYLDDKGYWRYSYGEFRGKRVHRVLMAKHLGRELTKEEHVHHRDNDKTNNGLHADGKWNLELMNATEHNAVSAKQLWYLKRFVWPKEEQEWREYFEGSSDSAPPQ